MKFRKKRVSKDKALLQQLVAEQGLICVCTLEGLCKCYALNDAGGGQLGIDHSQEPIILRADPSHDTSRGHSAEQCPLCNAAKVS